MKRVTSAVILSLALAGSTWGDSRKGDEEKGARDPLPRASKVKWDVRVFEDSPSFRVVKREVKGNRITWILENKRNLGTEITFGYQADLLDEDGVKVGSIGVECVPFLLNTFQGERNRYNLHMPPPDKLKGVRKVVIKNGNL
jgi:hypothetical protein